MQQGQIKKTQPTQTKYLWQADTIPKHSRLELPVRPSAQLVQQ